MFNLVKDDFDENSDDILNTINNMLKEKDKSKDNQENDNK